MEQLLRETLNLIQSIDRSDYQKVDRNTFVYKLIVSEIPNQLNDNFNLKNQYNIKGSVGQGNLAEVMWNIIGIPSISDKATKGYYIAILYKKDGSGFYISLNQSWTEIRKTKGKDRPLKESRAIAHKNAQVIRGIVLSEGIDLVDYLTSINLGEQLGETAKGYQHSNIIAKYYSFENIPSDKSLRKDIHELLNIYKIISRIISYKKYQAMIHENATSDLIYEVKKKDDSSSNLLSYYYKNKESFKLRSSPKATTVKENQAEYSTKKSKKSQSHEEGNALREHQADIGQVGELLARDYMLMKIDELAPNQLKEDLKKKVKLISEENENAGYDLVGFDISSLSSNLPEEVFYEVKTTTSSRPSEPFYISKNELNNIIENKDKLKIIRVYNLKKNLEPKCIIIDGFEKYNTVEELLNDKFNHVISNVKITGWDMQ